MASWTRQFPSKARGWLVLAVQILRIKDKPKSDWKCTSGCPSRPRWDKMCWAQPERVQPCGQTAATACPALAHWGLAAYSSKKRAEPPLRIWHSDMIFQLDQSAYIPVLLASLSFCLSFSIYFSLSVHWAYLGHIKRRQRYGSSLRMPQTWAVILFQKEQFLFFTVGSILPKLYPPPSSLHFYGIP